MLTFACAGSDDSSEVQSGLSVPATTPTTAPMPTAPSGMGTPVSTVNPQPEPAPMTEPEIADAGAPDPEMEMGEEEPAEEPVAPDNQLCASCQTADDCDPGAQCISLDNASGGFCTLTCETDDECGDGFMCVQFRGGGGTQCVPEDGICPDGSEMEEPEMEEPGMEDPQMMPPEEEPPVDLMPVDCNSLDEWDEQWHQFEVEVLEIVNLRRSEGADCGGDIMPPVDPLVMNDLLTCSSRVHSQDMAVRDFFAHDNPDGESPFDRMEAAGYEYRSAGENIAWGQQSPEQVMSGWMDSPGHCRNIMSDSFTELGVGYYLHESGDNRPRPFWTQNFGRPR